MTKADQTVESAADKLDAFVQQAKAAGGVKAKVGEALSDDPEFLRKLKPSLIKARAKGEAPPADGAGAQSPRRPAPASAPRAKRKGGGPNPWVVVAGALAVGYVLAKAIDWRGHAHPRL